MGSRKKPDIEIPTCADVSADGFQIRTDDWMVNLDFALSQPGQQDGKTIQLMTGRVRLPYGLAKVLAIGLTKALKAKEEKLGSAIPIPKEVCEQAGISPDEDWP